MTESSGTLTHTVVIAPRIFSPEEQRLREALQAILLVLGTGKCGLNTCEGCLIEEEEAVLIARDALAGIF